MGRGPSRSTGATVVRHSSRRVKGRSTPPRTPISSFCSRRSASLSPWKTRTAPRAPPPRRSRSRCYEMKPVSVLALWALVASCHIDKLLNGAKTPPSDAPPARVAFASSPASPRAGELITPPVQVTVQDSAGRATVRDTLVMLSLGAHPTRHSLRGTKPGRSVDRGATLAELRLDKTARRLPPHCRAA